MIDAAERMYEQVLVLRCQAGDESAFTEVVGKYDPRLRLYLRKILGPCHAIEDVLQDVWLDAFRGIGRLTDPEALCGWLYTIARGRAARLIRTRVPPASPLEDRVAAEETEEEFGPEDAAAIHAGLDALSLEHREVLLLRFVEQMNYGQIARVTGCGAGTVRSRLHYAKRALRAAIEEKSHERK